MPGRNRPPWHRSVVPDEPVTYPRPGPSRSSAPATIPSARRASERGALLASPYLPPRLLPAESFTHVPIPSGTGVNHWHQYVDAVRGKGETSAPFEYAAFLTEVALLGNVALHFPHETLAWDAQRMRFPERPEANRFLSSPVRDGWELERV